MYDLIGDIHGHAGSLVRLLTDLGYRERDGRYSHPDGRRVIFLGDFIDKGPEIPKVLRIARAMVDCGDALAVMGNHEFNAIAYRTPDPDHPGQFLRPHEEKNTHQHAATLAQLSEAEREDAAAWFRTLPAWLELDGLRVIHACWDDEMLGVLRAGLAEHGAFSDDFMRAACRKGTALYEAVDVTLKGKEVKLPPGVGFHDQYGHWRTDMRTKWYLDPRGLTYRGYSLPCNDRIPDEPVTPETAARARPYPPDAPPVFFGHYWLTDPQPARLAANVACLDYSVAAGGLLCGYRWQGERELTAEHFVVAR
jgi:hypothetical protein